jgi:hypothetical protein
MFKIIHNTLLKKEKEYTYMNEYQYYLDKKYLKQILDFYIKHELIDA